MIGEVVQHTRVKQGGAAVARLAHNQEVAGSIPAPATTRIDVFHNRPVSPDATLVTRLRCIFVKR